MNKQLSTACLFTLVLLSGACWPGAAQQALPAVLQQQVANPVEKGSLEQLYVHTDKTTYMAGEILWLKVYSVDALLHHPLDLSKVAYIDILDRANTPVAQAKIELQGKGSGSIQLPLSLSTGNYKLRGYTSWMKNAGAGTFFEQVVTIINPLKSFDNTRSAAVPDYDVAFFPEGGNLVQGLESRVAFKLTDASGRGIEGSGVVVSDGGDTLTTFTTHKFGIGSFTMRPEAGKSYKAVVTTAGGNQFTQSLPPAAAQGYTLIMTEEQAGTLMLRVHSNVPGQEGQPLYLLTHTRGAARGSAQAPLSGGAAVFAIKKNGLEEGVSQFTLFDAQGRPVGERLYFRRPSESVSLSARSDAGAYAPRSKVALTLQSGAPADLSLSVYRLDSLQVRPGVDIRSYLWLTSELSGTVEQPGYYLTASGAEGELATDLLMLSHGWRRLHWKETPAPRPAALYPLEYNGHLVRARVLDARSGAPTAGVPVYLSVPGVHFRFYVANSDSTGVVRFDVKDVYGPSELVLQTAARDNTTYRFEVLSPFSAQYTSDSLPSFRLPASAALLESHSIAMQAQNVYRGDSLRRFDVPNLQDTLPFYGKAVRSYALDEYTRFTTMEEVLREYVTEINVTLRGGKLYMHMLDEDRRQFYEDNVLVLVDGVPLADKNKIFDYDPHKVRQLDVVPKGYLLGTNYFKGVASFRTYEGDLKGFALDPRVLMVNYEGLQLQREFYAPVYETAAQQASRLPDLRTTLLWKPDVTTGEKGSSALSFYTSDNKGSYIGVLQGLDAQGHPLSATFTFVVK